MYTQFRSINLLKRKTRGGGNKARSIISRKVTSADIIAYTAITSPVLANTDCISDRF